MNQSCLQCKSTMQIYRYACTGIITINIRTIILKYLNKNRNNDNRNRTSQRYADGNQPVVDLVEHYKPCMSPSLSQELPV